MENIEQLLNGELVLFDTPKFKSAIGTAIKAFQKQYPAATTADWQTFGIAFRMGYGLNHSQNNKVTNIDRINQWKEKQQL